MSEEHMMNARTIADVDKDIEELEAELEIARLQAKLLKLRKAKQKEANARPEGTSTPASPASKINRGDSATTSSADRSDFGIDSETSLFPTDEGSEGETRFGHE